MLPLANLQCFLRVLIVTHKLYIFITILILSHYSKPWLIRINWREVIRITEARDSLKNKNK
jgi:hypothetical protein